MKKNSLLLMLILTTVISLQAQEYERYKKLTDTTIFSNYLGFEKNISVTVPFEWQANVDSDFPLIIIFDRQNPRSHNYIINTIDYLTSNEQMPSSIIISIESSQEFRYNETAHKESTEAGLALENENFLFNELIPLAENKFKANSFRLFIGHSRYGYFTTSLFISKTNDLNAAISISPFFSQKNVELTDSTMQLNNKTFNSTKYYRFAIGNDYPADFYEMDSVLNLINNEDIDASGIWFPQAEHNATPGLIIATALYDIFDFWSYEQAIYINDGQKDLSIITDLSKEITMHYGSPLRFSLGILNGKGWYFYNESEFEKAIEAWEILLENYPNFSEAYLYIIDAQNQLNINNEGTIIDFKNNLEMSSIYSESEKKDLLNELENLTQ
ncbi:MAG TPA: alpha/beta hydrolase-fold protein [Bacteroidales bacterium]